MKIETIQAKVNPKLLSKANRLFTGTLDGRIIEILQNARRAGATEVEITNNDGFVTVQDNGSGIDDFSTLLDLGNSDWDQATEEAEDPTGVGVFCLSPRQVTIHSLGKKVVIARDGWTGEPVEVHQEEPPANGTKLLFEDEPWGFDTVERNAVFTGMAVTVDGKKCASEAFCSEEAVRYPSLGCNIEVREKKSLNKWHSHFRRGYYSNDILVNFHGQVTAFRYSPVSEEELTFLVDMAGEPTGIRMMLPARTQLIENEAFEKLKAAIVVEAYRFIQKQGSHKLPFEQYKRAQGLGIELPESEPVFDVGTLWGDVVEPIEVTMPKDFPLEKCYRLNRDCQDRCETNEANVHLLAATGKFKEPFVPVRISSKYDGYSWTKLPTVNKIEVAVGKELGSDCIWNERLVAVDSLQITTQTSDGKVFKSDVLMAVLDETREKRSWYCTNVYVTLEARSQLSPSDIWFHCGGWNDDGDTYDTQMYYFEQDLEQFWAAVIGPGEYLRSKIRQCLFGVIKDWKKIIFEEDGTLTVVHKDGSEKVYKSP